MPTAQRRMYDIAFIHPSQKTRKKYLSQERQKGIRVFPVPTLDALDEFLSGEDPEGKLIMLGKRKARKYILPANTSLLSTNHKDSERIPTSQLVKTIQKYHPDAVIAYYQPSR